MRVKVFNNTTGLEQGDFIVPPSNVSGFDVSAHHSANTTAMASDEDSLEVLVDGAKYVLDVSNEPAETETQYAELTGYAAKTGGGYKGTWQMVTKPEEPSDPE